MEEKRIYWYSGAVTTFGRLLSNKWNATTRAKTKEEARRNFLYQYKKENSLLPGAKIELPGEITIVS